MEKTIKPLTVKKFKKIMNLGLYLGSYRHPEIEKKYQERDKNKDPINYYNKTLDWSLNDYPYYWQKGIEHWLLWYHGNWKEFEEKYEKWILKFTKTYILAWINPPCLRSINNFPHCHVLLWNKKLIQKKNVRKV